MEPYDWPSRTLEWFRRSPRSNAPVSIASQYLRGAVCFADHRVTGGPQKAGHQRPRDGIEAQRLIEIGLPFVN
jgi:hypothetical protein